MVAEKLSLQSALFINLNIILGTGIFINSVILARHVGAWGALTYIVVGTLLLPLILALAQLVTLHKGGSFYDYAANMHPAIGFLSQWSYFVGKLAACALGVHIFTSLMQAIFLPLQKYQALGIDLLIISFFVALNMFNLRINRSIQMLFFILKILPIFFIIIAGLIFLSPHQFINTSIHVDDIFVTIPFALYAFTGFEATCSLITTLKNPEADGPKAILYSYGLSVLIAVLFQSCLYMLVGPELRLAGTFMETFPLVFKKLFLNSVVMSDSVIVYATALVHSAIACSALGAAYGIMFSNSWNLYTLAQKGLVFGSNYCSKLTRFGVPFVCIIIEGIIALAYLWYTQGDQVSLQQINTLALTITFSLSVVGLIAYHLKRHQSPGPIACGAALSCGLLIIFLIKNFIYYQRLPALPFVVLVALGIVGFLTNFKQHQRT